MFAWIESRGATMSISTVFSSDMSSVGVYGGVSSGPNPKGLTLFDCDNIQRSNQFQSNWALSRSLL